jgi:hypothetical protein
MKKKFMPFGRVGEYVNTLSDADKRRAAVKSGVRLGDDDCVAIFPSREFMARMIRKEEQSSPQSKWRPVVRLTDGEGY